jgi:hypothetical protein
MKLTTTAAEIYNYRPCQEGFERFINGLFGKSFDAENIARMFAILTEEEKNREIDLLDILDNNGVEDTFWVLRTQEYKDYCLVLADVAEPVLHLYEKRYSWDDQLRGEIKAIRLYQSGGISLGELKTPRKTAYDIAYEATCTAYYNVYAYVNVGDTYTAVIAAEDQWQKNEDILRKYLSKE